MEERPSPRRSSTSRRGGLVINVATDRTDELVSFRAARYDPTPGATIYTFNLSDELPRMDAAGDLARIVTVLAQRKLVAPVELGGRLAARRPPIDRF